jgi:hypothetical protein
MMGLLRHASTALIGSVAAVQKALSSLVGVLPIFFKSIFKLDPHTFKPATRRAVSGGMVVVFAVLAHALFLGWIVFGTWERRQ